MRLRTSSPGIEHIYAVRRPSAYTNRPLKIALIAHLKYPIAQPYSGGLEMHTHLLARKLSQRGHRVTLYASNGSDPTLDLVPICDPTGNLSGLAETIAERRAYEEISERVLSGGFDLVHNNSLHPVPLDLAARLPVVSVLHTPPFSPLADRVRTSEGHFIAVSATVARLWRREKAVAAVVPNGVELDTFAPRGLRASPPRAIWFGRIVPEKGLHLAIEAARIASLELDFAGPITDRDYWANVIAPLCHQHTRYLGHLDHSTLRWHIAKAGVALVTPRWDEPFGLVAAEAIACGTPVAAFERGGLPDVIGKAGVLACPDDPVDLARAARQALKIDPTVCRRWAEDTLGCAAMVSQYEAIYDSILATPAQISAAAG